MVKYVQILFSLNLLSWSVFARPEWIHDPMQACSATKELCSVGRGSGSMVAEANARRAMAEFFETQVTGETIATKSSDSVESEGVVTSYTQTQDFFGQVKILTKQILEGVWIKKRYEDSDMTYALATLDKRKAAQRLQTEMRHMDEKLKAYLSDSKSSHFGKLKKIHKTRELINQRYQLLVDSEFPEVVTFRQIFAKRKRFEDKRAPIIVQIREESKLKELESYVRKWLLENDFKLQVQAKKNPSALRLKGSIRSEKLFLDVKGWVKYKFIFDLYTQNKQREKMGALRFDIVKTGRSFKQAYENAYPQITAYLDANLDDLNFE